MTGRRLVIDGLDADAINFIVAYCYGEYSTVPRETLFPMVAAAYHCRSAASLPYCMFGSCVILAGTF